MNWEGMTLGKPHIARTPSGVIVIGMDGLDPKILDEMMDRGELPEHS